MGKPIGHVYLFGYGRIPIVVESVERKDGHAVVHVRPVLTPPSGDGEPLPVAA